MPKVPAVATTDIGTALALVARVQHFNKPTQKFIRFRYTHKTNPVSGDSRPSVQADIVVRVGMKTAWMVDMADQGYKDFTNLSWQEKYEKKRPDGGWPIKGRRRYLAAEKVDVSIGEVGVTDDDDEFDWLGDHNCPRWRELAEIVDCDIRPQGECLYGSLTAPPKEAMLGDFSIRCHYASTKFRLWIGAGDCGIISATVVLDPKTHRVVAHIPIIDGWETDIAYINYE